MTLQEICKVLLAAGKSVVDTSSQGVIIIALDTKNGMTRAAISIPDDKISEVLRLCVEQMEKNP